MVGKILGEYEVNTEIAINSGLGTSGIGSIIIDYKILEKVFGYPTEGDGYKIDAEWDIFNSNTGKSLTIYNWKNGRNYNGCRAPKVQNLKEWHIGGHDESAVNEILDLIRKYSRLEKLNEI